MATRVPVVSELILALIVFGLGIGAEIFNRNSNGIHWNFRQLVAYGLSWLFLSISANFLHGLCTKAVATFILFIKFANSPSPPPVQLQPIHLPPITPDVTSYQLFYCPTSGRLNRIEFTPHPSPSITDSRLHTSPTTTK